MAAGNKIVLSSFAYEGFRLPVFVVKLASAEDIFPSVARLPAEWASYLFLTKTTRVVLEEYRLFAYGQN
jgi:hypothetical protein